MNRLKVSLISLWYFSKYSPYQLFFTMVYLYACCKILFNTKSVRQRTEELLEYLASMDEFEGDSISYLSRIAIGIQHFECSADYTSRLFNLLQHATEVDLRPRTLNSISNPELRRLVFDFAYPSDEKALKYSVRWAKEETGYIPDTVKYVFDRRFPIDAMIA